ncbi:MAG: TonB-dependent siderophore receptor [Nodosilinea sp.]
MVLNDLAGGVMGVRWQRLVWLAGWLALVPMAAQAETVLSLQDIAQPSGQAADLELAQGLTQITGVRIEPEGEGLRLVLDADGALGEPTIEVVGNALVAEIANAVLALPEGESFEQFGPAEGIALVAVTNESGNRVRVSITGSDGPPAVEISSGAAGLVLGITPGLSLASDGDDTIRIGVTGEGDEGYAPRNSSTATRTDTPLRDIPQSIQVIPRQVIEDQQVIRLDEAVRNVSGVTQGDGFAGTLDRFTIRGFSQFSSLRNGFLEENIGFRDPANIERIEVLKGPASVLYGSLEPGGIISVITEQPLAEPRYSGELLVGNDAFIRSAIDLTGPLSSDDSLGYRLNVAYETSEGFRGFDQGVERIFVAPVLAWQISDATRLVVDLEYLQDERPFDSGPVAIGDRVADLPRNRVLGELNDVREVEEFRVGYLFEHQFNENLRLRNGFRYNSGDSFDLAFRPVTLDEETGILSRNVRSNDDYLENYAAQTNLIGEFSTGSIDHTLLLGFDFNRRTNIGTQRRLPLGTTPSINIFAPEYGLIATPDLSELTNVVRDGSDRTDTFGFYVQDQIEILDNLNLLVGGRFDIVEQQSFTHDTGESSGRSDAAFSPRIGILYQPIEPISLYASYSRSFAPNFGTAANGSFLEPERGTQYEISMRGEITNNLAVTLAAYEVTKTNIATTDPNNDAFSISAGEQRSRGIELDVLGQILPGWNIIAAYTYADAQVTESNDFELGNLVQNVPRNSASLWTTYEIQSGTLEGLGFGLGLFYVGERQGDLENSFRLDSYLRTDAALYYRRDHWRAALNVKNLFDRSYIEGSEFGRTEITFGTPFTIIGSIAVEF